jgi:hypothetical protein
MNLPKFSAEASLGPSTGHYVGINRLDSANKAGKSQVIEPQGILVFLGCYAICKQWGGDHAACMEECSVTLPV